VLKKDFIPPIPDVKEAEKENKLLVEFSEKLKTQ